LISFGAERYSDALLQRSPVSRRAVGG